METWTLEVSKELVRRGHSVVVYTYKVQGHKTDEVIDGVKIRRFGPSVLSCLFGEVRPYPYLPRLLMFFWLVKRLARDRDIDVVLATYVPLIFVTPFTDLLHVKVWGIFHGFYDLMSATAFKGLFRGFVGAFAQLLALKMRAKGFVVVGNEVKRALLLRGVKENRVKLIKGGVNLAEFDHVQVSKTRYPQLCFVSRMTPEKRLDDLIKAFALVRKQIPNSKLIVVGDGLLRNQWQHLAQSLSLDDSIHFKGMLRGFEKIKILKESHIMIHPSLQEGMSLAIFESWASSTPVIAYDIPQIREQFTFAGSGIVVPPRNVEALANAIVCLLLDASLCEKMARLGRATVESSLTWKKVSEELLQLFEGDCRHEQEVHSIHTGDNQS
jgi:glycosyltransferase involved in cell wall biosynthesis